MLIRADARSLPLRDACVDCIVTSPPYWGLRDYGVSGQIGLERTYQQYITAIASLFREDGFWRVLKDTGTVWLNLGDSYHNGDKGGYQPSRVKAEDSMQKGNLASDFAGAPHRLPQEGLKPKDLVGMPWRVALAIQSRGWFLRSDIVWSKPNPMPESVTDRPTKAHEYLFLLTKQEKYYYDQTAIAEPLSRSSMERYQGAIDRKEAYDPTRHKHSPDRAAKHHRAPMEVLTKSAAAVVERGTRNKRSVWEIPTQCFDGAHFATMPEALVEPCILAGCPLGGLVLDPFVGSGTVVAVAERLGRRGVGVDLSYQQLAKERTAQRGLRFEVNGRAEVLS